MSTLTAEEITNFWIRVYFGTTNREELISEVINRAYRDWNRTAHGLGKIEKTAGMNAIKDYMKVVVQEITTNTYNKEEFDNWHKNKCITLINLFVEQIRFRISFGQAQKWINMTLKYLFALGEVKIHGINKNYQHFHIPIDSIIQNKFKALNIRPLKNRWSRIENYDTYIQYQNKVRERFSNEIPCDIEFRLFNE